MSISKPGKKCLSRKIMPGGSCFVGLRGPSPQDKPLCIEICLMPKKHLGIYLKDSGLMMPEKSMAGIVVANYSFSCRACSIRSKCDYLRQAKTCYGKPAPERKESRSAKRDNTKA